MSRMETGIFTASLGRWLANKELCPRGIFCAFKLILFILKVEVLLLTVVRCCCDNKLRYLSETFMALALRCAVVLKPLYGSLFHREGIIGSVLGGFVTADLGVVVV
ncbi:hypothetical protein [Bartonella sp. CR127HXZ]|uniref:hypothetical protein n=1 Tax=Bartonella sp. CR127HXZ TaxID=1460985 RepID=UPI0035CF64D8